jgi:hypothetical protein
MRAFLQSVYLQTFYLTETQIEIGVRGREVRNYQLLRATKRLK